MLGKDRYGKMKDFFQSVALNQSETILDQDWGEIVSRCCSTNHSMLLTVYLIRWHYLGLDEISRAEVFLKKTASRRGIMKMSSLDNFVDLHIANRY